MKDKIILKNKTHFDFLARKLGVIGVILIVLSFALGIPLINVLNTHNTQLVNDIQKEEMQLSNLQVQQEDGTITISE